MKKLFLLIALTMTVMLGYAQDIITFKDGTSVKGHVSKITDSLVEYMDADSTKCAIAKSQIFSINYANGSVDTFAAIEQGNGFSPITSDPDLTRKLRRYKIWSKITCIYGVVNVGMGLLWIASSNSIDADDYDEDVDIDLVKKVYKIIVNPIFQD